MSLESLGSLPGKFVEEITAGELINDEISINIVLISHVNVSVMAYLIAFTPLTCVLYLLRYLTERERRA